MSFLAATERLRLSWFKKAALNAEPVELSRYLTPEALEPKVIAKPFPHVIIDNFFLPEAYAAIEQRFLTDLARGTTTDLKRQDMFQAFDIDYDGFKYTPRAPIPGDPFFVFFSAHFNQLFSSIFKQQTTLETSLGFHHHPPGNKTGFVHHDFVDKYFDVTRRLPNFVIPNTVEKPKEATQGRQVVPEKRIIALLFYLANAPWKEGDGGETGLYASSQSPTPALKIAPKNNRMLAFHISKDSYHAFQSNTTPRNCIVQWFHMPEHLL